MVLISEQAKILVKSLKEFDHEGFDKWYKEHTYPLDEKHDVSNKELAFKRSLETGKYPTGANCGA